MGFFRIGRKKSTSNFPAVFPDSNAFLHAPAVQHGALALPTNLEDVVRATHTGVPRHLPGEDASQDEVRYFLYQILTLKEYRISLGHPQWVLETCMYWNGDGGKLRSLPPDAFQKLCPLSPGYASINWRSKGCKFERQQIPPCDVRNMIGGLIKQMVVVLKTKEIGNQGPGWKGSNESPGLTGGASDDLRNPQAFAPQLQHRFSTPPFADPSGFTAPHPFYHFGNHSLPVMNHSSFFDTRQPSICMQHQMSAAESPHVAPATSGYQRMFSPDRSAKYVPDKRPSDERSHPSSPPSSPPGPSPGSSPGSSSRSPISSYCQTESITSRISTSTAKTTPPSSETEKYFKDRNNNRPRSIARSLLSAADSGYTSPGMYQVPAQRTTSATPTRYKASAPSSAIQTNNRSYDPKRYSAHLRYGSYGSNLATHSPYEASLAPSDSATNAYSSRHDFAMPPNVGHPSSRRANLFQPALHSNASNPSLVQSYTNARHHVRPAMPEMVSAIPLSRSPSTIGRPLNNYKVDTHAFDSAEHVSLKSKPSPARSLMVEEAKNRAINRRQSEVTLSKRFNNFLERVRGDEESVGPSIRFQNPRTGQPRLTIYETIEEKEKLAKLKLNSKGRLDMWRGRGLTVYETIEEKEILDGKPNRGVDTGKNWRRYF